MIKGTFVSPCTFLTTVVSSMKIETRKQGSLVIFARHCVRGRRRRSLCRSGGGSVRYLLRFLLLELVHAFIYVGVESNLLVLANLNASLTVFRVLRP